MALQGKTQAQVTEMHAGDLGADREAQGRPDRRHALGQGHRPTFPPIAFAAPLMSYALEPKSRGDEDKICRRCTG